MEIGQNGIQMGKKKYQGCMKMVKKRVHGYLGLQTDKKNRLLIIKII